MNSTDVATLNNAIALAKIGEKEQAHSMLANLLQQNPNEPNLLLWIAFTASNLEESRRALTQVAKVDPSNPNLANALNWLIGQTTNQEKSIQVIQPSQDVQIVPSNKPKEVIPQSYQLPIPPQPNKRPLEIKRENHIVNYELSGGVLDGYNKLVNTFLDISHCSRIELLEYSTDNVYYRSSAGTTVKTKGIRLTTHKPPAVKTNINAPEFNFKDTLLYFMPEVIWAFSGKTPVGSIPYRDIMIEVSQSKMQMADWVPDDATVIDYTWLFCNIHGGPDHRYSQNPRIPICAVDILSFSFQNFLNRQIYIYKIGVAEQFKRAVDEYSMILAHLS
jgi:hypothetical protein